MRKQTRLYADTSVFGGILDAEFATISRKLFAEISEGRHLLLVSEITAQELRGAPAKVRNHFASILETHIEHIAFTQEMIELRDAYIQAGVIGPRWLDDAAHVAAATVARADVLVSWNFRHLVKLDKIRSFNAVNLGLGYPIMTILSPREVISDEQDI